MHAGLLEDLAFDAILKRLARLQKACQRTVKVTGELFVVTQQDLVIRLARDRHDDSSVCSRVVDVMQAFPAWPVSLPSNPMG